MMRDKEPHGSPHRVSYIRGEFLIVAKKGLGQSHHMDHTFVNVCHMPFWPKRKTQSIYHIDGLQKWQAGSHQGPLEYRRSLELTEWSGCNPLLLDR